MLTTRHLRLCRVGPVAGSPGPAATLVNGGEVAGDSPIFGRKLPEFRQMVDLILERVLPRPHPVIKGFTSPGPRRPDTNSLITGRAGAGPGRARAGRGSVR
ncbi:hypothetical protein DQE82_28895 [Micromonospora sp. LHW51205]|nr:hypothetical protein DQE82_28895 [Micromonospora sp. LHW51205]